MPKKVIIIGAGVTGMSLASLLRLKGFDTEIFEAHKKPGGLMTYWKRNDFTVETCIHWLVGSGKGSGMRAQWDKVVDMDRIAFHDYETYTVFEDSEGHSLRFFTDIDRLEDELLEKAPEDEKKILEFTAGVRKMIRFRIPFEYGEPGWTTTLRFLAGNLSLLGEYRHWSRLSERRFAEDIRNPLLKKAFENLFAPDMSMVFILMTLAWMHNRQAGYPVGGSLMFSRMMEARVLELGGIFHYKSVVKRVVVEGDRAIGIELEDGSLHAADWVVSAADGMETLTQFLKPEFTEEYRRKHYTGLTSFPSYFQLSLGIRGDLGHLPDSLDFALAEPLRIGPKTSMESLNWRIFNYDRSLSPEGCTLVTCFMPSYEFDYWDQLRKEDRNRYDAEKAVILEQARTLLLARLGVSTDDVLMSDLSTPSTVYRYTRNHKGSMEGWLMTADMPMRNLPYRLKGLKNFCMAGHWVSPGGGLPTGLMTAIDVSRIIR